MSWQLGQRIVAEATGATVRGSSIAGGARLHIDVTLRLVEWPWKENGTGQVHFTLALTTAALVALMTLVAHPVWLAQHPGYAPGIEEAAR